MSTLKVDNIRHNSATSDAITMASDGTCTARITGITGGGQLSHRNLVINGACLVAQRGESSTLSGYATVDRFKAQHSGTDEAPTQSQADVASGTTPYSLGFRKCLKILNGNQTSVSTSDYMWIQYRIESQDIANSGWNYTSTSSFITLSFWVKSSVAQDFKGYLKSFDGTSQGYPFATGSLTADTWTKITKTIPGNPNLQFDNNNDNGLEINILPYLTTDYTNNSATENAWGAMSSSARSKDTPSDWWTTDNATFELTGIQLEVGDTATSFEHHSYADELRHCRRYFCKYVDNLNINFVNEAAANYAGYLHFPFYETMRAAPTVTMGSNVSIGRPQVGVTQKVQSADSITPNCFNVIRWNGQGQLGSHGDAYYRMILSAGDSNSYIDCSAEL